MHRSFPPARMCAAFLFIVLSTFVTACGGGGSSSQAIPVTVAPTATPTSNVPQYPPPAAIPSEGPLPTFAPPGANPTQNPLPSASPDFTTVQTPPPAWNYRSSGPDRSLCAPNEGLVYHVGPNEAYKNPHDVPWLRLLPCDQVFIDYRPTPYVDRINITVRGAQGKAIRIAGVPGPGGALPVFDGLNAIEYSDEAWNQYEEPFGMITIGLAQNMTNYGHKPGFLIIENLEIRNVNADNPNAGYQVSTGGVLGAKVQWDGVSLPGAPAGHAFGTALYVYPAEHVVFRNLYIHDNSMGAFVNSQNGEAGQSRDFIVTGNRFANNGSLTHAGVHNFYFEVIGERVLNNHFGPPINQAQGENIKDRSVCVEYSDNYIEGGNHSLAFRDPQSNAQYETAEVDALGVPCLANLFFHGNTIVSTGPQVFGEMSEILGFGDGEVNGPGNDAYNRYGDVYFYNNVVVARGDYPDYGSGMIAAPIFENPSILKPSTMHVINSMFYATPASSSGVPLAFARCNWQGSVYFSNSWMAAGNTTATVPVAPMIATLAPAVDGVEANGSPCDMNNLGEPGSTGPSLTMLYTSSPNSSPGFANLAGYDYHTTGSSPFAALVSNTSFPAAITQRGLLPDGVPYP